MAVLLFWKKGKKRSLQSEDIRLDGCSLVQVQAQAPAVRGFVNGRFWKKCFRELTHQNRLLCGGQEELQAMGETFGLLPVERLPVMRQLAAPLAKAMGSENHTVVLHSRCADGMTVETALALCGCFPRVSLCVGRESEMLADFLRQKNGAAPLIGERAGLQVILSGEKTQRESPVLDLSGRRPAVWEQVGLTLPQTEKLPLRYGTELCCLLVQKNAKCLKSVQIVGFS